ncbi:MAG TPA: PTS system mannose/fructose/sorbose family transporter subunit IID [Gemmatimonadales bacterium]|nr:PTS system mannose/fructose/sorbose family transporter subunit IID [Gemmatimonadales bacterium]
MRGHKRALARLLMLQATWNFERMQGVGMGYAALPLLEDLARDDKARHADAVARSAEFFNCHPYLAGIALGATVRAEYDGVPGQQVLRLRTALCGPLGALGDRLFWTGVVPSAMAAACLALTQGAGPAAIVTLVVLYNILRLATGIWALRTGLAAGLRVSAALTGSWLTRAAERIGPIAGFSIGVLIPKSLVWLLDGAGAKWIGVAAIVAVTGAALSYRYAARATSFRYALAALAASLVLAGRYW